MRSVPTPMLRRPHLAVPVFALRDGTVRLGWNPERSYLLTPPPPLESEVLLDLLRRLDGEHSRAHMIWFAGTVGLSANSMSTLLAELAEAGLLIEGAIHTPARRGTPSPATVVHVLGRGPLSDAIVAGLTPSATLTLKRSAVTPTQLLVPVDEWACDIVVLTDDMAPDPRVVTGLVRSRTPHLQVRLRDDLGIVGPLVMPGITSCLRCADLVRGGLDRHWPHVSAQLLGRVGHATKPTVLATAAVALAQIEAFVVDGRAPLADTTVEIDLRHHVMNRRRWDRHPRCDCAL